MVPGIVAGCTLFACAPRARMCVAQADCGAQLSCVAGRCQADSRVAAVQSPGVRRLVVAPVDAAFVRRGDGGAPGVFALGRASDAGATLLLRFEVTLPPTAQIIEAYLLLDRSNAADADPSPIQLHAARIVEKWDGPSVTWARQPRIEEVRSPTTVTSGMRSLVRVDVREIVKRWREHSPDDQGVAVMADGTSATGIPFVFAPPRPETAPHASDMERLAAPRPPPPTFFASAGGSDDTPTASSAGTSPPRLEIYVK